MHYSGVHAYFFHAIGGALASAIQSQSLDGSPGLIFDESLLEDYRDVTFEAKEMDPTLVTALIHERDEVPFVSLNMSVNQV